MDNPVCFCCGKDIISALTNISVEEMWESPQGLHFSDRGNYGSAVHDSFTSGEKYEILICDDCLKKNWLRGRLVKVVK